VANPIDATSKWLTGHDSAPLIALLLLAFVGGFWLFNLSSLPLSNPGLMRASGGEGLLDVRPFYTAGEAYAAMQHYGPAGRTLYRHFLAADGLFSLVYSLGFGLLFTRLLRALYGRHSPWMRLNLLPVAIGLFDGLENLLILGMLNGFPQPHPIIATLAGLATLLKTVLTLCALLMLVLGTLRLAYQSRRPT